jgi:excisionase family DNA binding protein
MTNNQKQQLIAEVVALLQHRITELERESVSTPQPPPQSPQAVEMLTIKECAECVKGISAHTIRQLVLQGKIPSVRTGAGQNGKILVSKSALLSYFGELGGVA